MENITIAFCVGGSKEHYDSLNRSLRSIKDNIKCKHKIIVFDADDKLKTCEEYKVIHLPVEKSNIHGYQYQRYRISDYIDTEWCIYADNDIIFYQDRIDFYLKEARNFTLTQHFWVPKISNYLLYHNIPKSIIDYLFDGDLNANYYASGIFAFKPKEHKPILEEVRQRFKEVHLKNLEGNKHVTDECVLASVLRNHNVNIVNGAWNHSALPNLMPLEFRDGILYGSNPFDKNLDPVFCFHSDITRRKPHENFQDKEIKRILKESFYL